MPSRDPEKRKAQQRAWYEANREKAIARAAAYRHASPENRARWQRWKREQRYRAGGRSLAEVRATEQAREMDRLAEANAIQAWRHWLRRRAPAAWLLAYYTQVGRPWVARGLTPGQVWSLRYALDPAWRQQEYARCLAAKRHRRKLIARLRLIDAETLSDAEEEQLRLQGIDCFYCGTTLTDETRTLDHVISLSIGGRHVRSNLRHACLACNSAKQDRVW